MKTKQRNKLINLINNSAIPVHFPNLACEMVCVPLSLVKGNFTGYILDKDQEGFDWVEAQDESSEVMVTVLALTKVESNDILLDKGLMTIAHRLRNFFTNQMIQRVRRDYAVALHQYQEAHMKAFTDMATAIQHDSLRMDKTMGITYFDEPSE